MKHRTVGGVPVIVLYRVLVALSALVFVVAYVCALTGHQVIPWPIESAALAVLLSGPSLTSRFLR